MTLYNGSKVSELSEFLLPLKVLWPMGLMFENPSDQTSLEETYFKSVVNGMPSNQDLILDLEGIPAAAATQNEQFWFWDENPTEAVTNFTEAITWAKEIRPDLRIALYGIPYRVSEPRATRETALAGATQYADFISFQAYYRSTHTSLADWEADFLIRVNSLQYHTPTQVRVLVSDKIPEGPQLSGADFTTILNKVKALGFDIVFWRSQADGLEDIPQDIQTVLRNFSIDPNVEDWRKPTANTSQSNEELGPQNADATAEDSNYLICQRSGFKISVEEGLVKSWDGLWVRLSSLDRRHPQDFVRARAETPSGSVSPELPDVFVDYNFSIDYIYTEDGQVVMTEDGQNLTIE